MQWMEPAHVATELLGTCHLVDRAVGVVEQTLLYSNACYLIINHERRR